MTDLKALATAERRDLADFLETLSAEQWEQPSLCSGWTVHQVVAHMVSYEELSLRQVAGRFLRGRFVGGRVNGLGVDAYGRRAPDELVALLWDHLEPRGLTAQLGCRIALTDGLIHHQDIRRPLGLPRDIPHDRLSAVLSFALKAPPLPAHRNQRGLHLVASDVGWTHGTGPTVSGPGEALLLAVAGRRDALPDLEGDGLEILRDRVLQAAGSVVGRSA